MLPLHTLSKCNRKLSKRILFQWINISTRLCSSSSSSSSSSDSSDSDSSDSDVEKTKSETTQVKSASSASETSDTKYDLESFLNNMIQTRKLQKTIDVAMQPKKKSKDKNKENLPFENKIINAAKDVADTLGGDKTKTMSDLLEKVVASRVQALREEQAKIIKMQKNAKFKRLAENNIQENSQDKHAKKQSMIQTLLDEYNKQSVKVVEPNTQESSQGKHTEKKSIIQTLLEQYNKQPVKVVEHNIQESSQDKHSEKKSVIQTLLNEYYKQPKKIVEDSISKKLLKSAKASEKELQNIKEKRHVRLKDIDLWNGKPSHIFENMNAASPNIPELKTWAALEQRELKALTTYPPANIFQELILWTEQGKLWKFPIDNEQGMEEEYSVHFSEHVFMERHLKGWCPKSGPIRHFMELVCVGLSKNPYLTVQEKVQHIMWYKEYFESKQDILQEIGAIQESFPDKVKEIAE